MRTHGLFMFCDIESSWISSISLLLYPPWYMLCKNFYLLVDEALICAATLLCFCVC